MSTLRPYQIKALASVAKTHETVKRVCLVMPTGAGKSVVGREWVQSQLRDDRRVLVLAHRSELLRQFRGHLDSVGIRSGIISPDFPPDEQARVQIASMDTLVARDMVPYADAILSDECHHDVSRTWSPLIESLPDALVLGLTATPQRSDGKPLGDLYDEIVIGAQYSELLDLGHICRVKILRPARYLGSDFAQEPVDAWMAHAGGKKGFAFCRTVKDCKKLAQDLRDRGVAAAHIDGKTTARDRIDIMTGFRSGAIRVICNVYVLTEGVDVPDAEVCMLARSPQHAGTYLQMVGRVLRPAPGKPYAILIDLPGCSHPDMHGAPTADRDYALSGKAIATTGEALKNCPQCGMTESSTVRECSECGYKWPVRIYDGPKIWNLELMEFFNQGGEIHEAPKQIKEAEFLRLLAVSESKNLSTSWMIGQYERMFGERPAEKLIKDISDERKVGELKQLLSTQKAKDLKMGWISHRYKATFGSFPPRALRKEAGVPVPSSEWSALWMRVKSER